MRIRNASHRRSLSFMLILTMMVVGSPFSASADDSDTQKMWTTVASAGTMDAASLSKAALFGPYVAIQDSAAPTATVKIRYNIVAVDGLFYGNTTLLVAGYRDNGSGARIVLRLKRLNLSSGTVTTLLTFNSDNFAPASGYQTKGVNNICQGPNISFNFASNAYFIDAEITKINSSGTPALAIIKLERIFVIDCP